jgi:hypothetical protein
MLVCDSDAGMWCVMWYRICDFVMRVETRNAAVEERYTVRYGTKMVAKG